MKLCVTTPSKWMFWETFASNHNLKVAYLIIGLHPLDISIAFQLPFPFKMLQWLESGFFPMFLTTTKLNSLQSSL